MRWNLVECRKKIKIIICAIMYKNNTLIKQKIKEVTFICIFIIQAFCSIKKSRIFAPA